MKALPLLSLLLLLVVVSSVTGNPLRGVKKSDESLYGGATFMCRDGSQGRQQLPASFINDDYCDCRDGSDEPGTSACSNGKFWCRNNGFEGKLVPSSRVNDRICDCCDGSDEYLGHITCADTCREMGAEAQKGVLEEIRVVEEGAKIRAEWVAAAKRVKADRESDRDLWKAQLEVAIVKFNDAKAVKETEEKLEKEIKDKFEEEKRANETAAATAAGIAPIDGAANPPVAATGTDAAAPATPVADTPAAAADTGSAAFPYPAEYAYQEKKEDTKENFPYPAEYMAPSDGDDGTDVDEIDASETEEFDLGAEDEIPTSTTSTTPTTPSPPVVEVQHEEFGSWFSRQIGTIKEWMGWTQSAADTARTMYATAEQDKRSLQEKIDQVEKLLGFDYGSDGEFTSLQGKCFSLVQRQYTYEVCPYDEGRQKEGHSATSLGKWSGWDTSANGERIMKFEHGVRCWNGPDRSLTVTLYCSNVNEAVSVDEPNKCIYTMRLGTPAVCNADHAAKLRASLATQFHDEL